jgi:hypothetical protein
VFRGEIDSKVPEKNIYIKKRRISKEEKIWIDR